MKMPKQARHSLLFSNSAYDLRRREYSDVDGIRKSEVFAQAKARIIFFE